MHPPHLTLTRDPGFDRRKALLAQRERIEAQTLRLRKMLDLINRTLLPR